MTRPTAGVVPGTVGVAGVAAAQLLGRDAVVVRFPAGSGWSIQALLDQRASLDTSALVRVSVAVGARKLSGKNSCRSTGLASRRGALDLRLLCRRHRHTEARCRRLLCRLRPEGVITLLGGASVQPPRRQRRRPRRRRCRGRGLKLRPSSSGLKLRPSSVRAG